jgi:hypothetical protein
MTDEAASPLRPHDRRTVRAFARRLPPSRGSGVRLQPRQCPPRRLQGNSSAFARDSSAFERVDFLNERQAMTRTLSDIDDIGGTPHLVEDRFRLNGAAAIFEIIHTQEFPVRQFEGKQKNSVFCIRRHFHSCKVLAPRAQPPQDPAQRAELQGEIAKADAQHSYPSLAPWLAATSAPS